jgi:two-component system CheB/CheR fusion protein
MGTQKMLELTPRFSRTNLLSKKKPLPVKSSSTNSVSIDNIIDSAILLRYMPACAVINKDMEILQLRGSSSLFLSHPSGKASLNILKMARPEFAFELRNAIFTAIKTKQSVIKSDIEIKIESVFRMMSLEVSHLTVEWEEPLLLIVFTLQEQVEKIIETDKHKKNYSTVNDRKIKKLSEELHHVRTEMNSIIESQENTFEELQAANEEIISTNEEFQTLNEELETSKEEIQATNEELISTNQELQMRNDLLSESYEYSNAIIATIHEPMLVLHRNFTVKSANKSFYDKFRVKQEDTEGVVLFDLGNKQWNITKLREVLNDIISKNKSFENFEVTHTFQGIGEKVMLLNAHLIVQKTNSEQLILLAIEDITERTETSRYARSLIEASLDPLVTISIEGKITDMNEATVNITGVTRKKLTGTDFFDYFTEPQKARDVYQGIFAKGSVADSPLTLRHKNGELTDVLFNGSVYKDDKGKVLGVVIVARDVTDQKLIEKELLEAKVFAELATALAEEAKVKAERATLTAEEATRIAEDAVKAKQQFLSNMSHEIRTPMNAIIGFTKVVEKTDLTEKQREYISAIKMSGDALIVLINDILDLAKVDAGKMTFEKTPFKMISSISSMLHLFETKIQEKNLELIKKYDAKIPEVLLGDSVRLHQIIINLVSNAVKFTSKGKIVVSVNLLVEDEEKTTIEFAITDDGIGIEKNKIATIFENFQQATSDTSRLYGGTGLGLAIVKQLVEQQGGTVNVKSKINEGSTFSFTLNFYKTKAEAMTEIDFVEADSTIKNIKVLVVEDIALNQLLMKTLLDDFGFERDIASNGKIALEMLQSKSYDIILMDLQMPEMNGFEATEYIRKKLHSQIPIIALTADVTTVDLEKCRAVGMNDYIAKPVDERILYSKIVSLVKKITSAKDPEIEEIEFFQSDELKYTDLSYLQQRTKSNAKLMMEMISIYLEQTPKLVTAMKHSLLHNDWDSLGAAAHKMIPSFSIMGINSDFEKMAHIIQESASSKQNTEEIPDMVTQLDTICLQIYKELKEEYSKIKNSDKN